MTDDKTKEDKKITIEGNWYLVREQTNSAMLKITKEAQAKLEAAKALEKDKE